MPGLCPVTGRLLRDVQLPSELQYRGLKVKITWLDCFALIFSLLVVSFAFLLDFPINIIAAVSGILCMCIVFTQVNWKENQ